MGNQYFNDVIILPFTVWPANLVLCALFNTLHSQNYAGMGSRGGVSRERFFVYAFAGATCYCTFTSGLFLSEMLIFSVSFFHRDLCSAGSVHLIIVRVIPHVIDDH